MHRYGLFLHRYWEFHLRLLPRPQKFHTSTSGMKKNFCNTYRRWSSNTGCPTPLCKDQNKEQKANSKLCWTRQHIYTLFTFLSVSYQLSHLSSRQESHTKVSQMVELLRANRWKILCTVHCNVVIKWQTRWGPDCRQLSGRRIKKLRASFIKQKLIHTHENQVRVQANQKASEKDKRQSIIKRD